MKLTRRQVTAKIRRIGRLIDDLILTAPVGEERLYTRVKPKEFDNIFIKSDNLYDYVRATKHDEEKARDHYGEDPENKEAS